MDIVFTKHARDKFSLLKRHGFAVTKERVFQVVQEPDFIDRSRLPLLIAQKTIDDTHVLRVVYKQKFNVKMVITFYPGRRSQYDKSK